MISRLPCCVAQNSIRVKSSCVPRDQRSVPRHDRVVHGHLLGLGDPRLEVLAVPRRDRPGLGVGHHADDRHPLPVAERAGLLILGLDPDALLPAALELPQPRRDQRPLRALSRMHHRMRRRFVRGARLRRCI
jgi:hypothetical protein